jgi:glycine C-acetyltransferase
VPVLVGSEGLARMVCQKLPPLGIVVNLVEYPAVAKGNARVRLQVMPQHSPQNIDDLIDGLRLATDAASLAHRHLTTVPLETSNMRAMGA